MRRNRLPRARIRRQRRAPALARADVGFAVGIGTDVAIETTDITWMAGSLGGVVTAIALSRAMIRNIRQNLSLAIGYNAAGIPIAAAVLYPFTGWLLGPDDRRGRDGAVVAVGAEQRQPAAPLHRETGANTDADRRSARSGTGRDYREFVTTTVLVVDDERKLRNLLRDYLEREGYAVLEAADGQAALDLARAARPDLVVLDLGLPGLPGDEVARLLRKDNDVPIVMLTAKASENDRVAGLRLGADDYVVKPFSPRELVARVEAVLRRSGTTRTDISTDVAYGGGRLRIDGERREVRVDGALVELTRSEFDLLDALASRPGRAWVRIELVSRIQGYAFEAYERTIDVHVKNLRRKLGDTAPFQLIATVPGIGYKLGIDRDA